MGEEEIHNPFLTFAICCLSFSLFCDLKGKLNRHKNAITIKHPKLCSDDKETTRDQNN